MKANTGSALILPPYEHFAQVAIDTQSVELAIWLADLAVEIAFQTRALN